MVEILQSILFELREIRKDQKEIKKMLKEISSGQVILNENLHYHGEIISKDKSQELEVIKVLDELKVAKDRAGYSFLKKAILISLETGKTDMQHIYDRIKREDNIDKDIIEKEIKQVIITVKIRVNDATYKVFGSYKLSCDEKGFISGIADYVKMQKD